MTPAPLEGVFLINLEKREDERGFFARTFCSEEFREKGLETAFVQANDSFSIEQGTLRGMHYQLPPFAETKLVRCIKGSLYDAVLDLREDSPTFGQSFGTILSADNRTMMYVPRGFAHGFLTLEPYTEVYYLVSAPYSPKFERGIRWNDPRFNISWPEPPRVISERDNSHPDFL
nr:dTDP-4-dehydrorhamnose 3,5-epimerase [Waddlia chondrophila]